MVDDYNCPIKDKHPYHRREYSIQFCEIDRLSFRDFAELFIPINIVDSNLHLY